MVDAKLTKANCTWPPTPNGWPPIVAVPLHPHAAEVVSVTGPPTAVGRLKPLR
jgi:hypothetical protein